MKVRTRFISNSSSSSYIIEYLNQDSCSSCNRYDDVLALSGARKIAGKAKILLDLEGNIRCLKSETRRLKILPSDKPDPLLSRWDDRPVEKLLSLKQKDLAFLENLYAIVAKTPNSIIKIEISQDDEHADSIFREAIKNGKIRIIRDYYED